ncbi:uncharacterized protein LODBEIA_P21880 [Lodderomyces beijingensis]|uniref:Uncharacterized protein n=1 Tax=Lodderomyces beijingensis TaxID=1775926 RepID=A0ABP0ZII4_9ASCO
MLSRATAPCRGSCLSRRYLSLAAKEKRVLDKKANDDRKIFTRRKKDASSCHTPPSASTAAAPGSAQPPNTTTTKNNNASSIPAPPKYLPVSQLPRIPEHLQAQSLESIYKQLGQQHILQRVSNPPMGVNFVIPAECMKQASDETARHHKPDKAKELDSKIKEFISNSSSASPDKPDDKSLIQLGREISSRIEPDHNEIYAEAEHPLKRTLSGLQMLYPAMHQIHDSFLWQVIPEDKLCGVPPYQTDDALGFKQWEQDMINQQEKQKLEKEMVQRELQEFQSLMGDTKSFFYDSESAANGHRRKLNRKLLKRFKKLKQEGKIPEKKEKLVVEYELL